jgi:P-type Mg2+ transporter
LESLASPALIATSVVICMVSIALPFTIVDGSLGFVPLPPVHWTVVLAIIGCYAILTQKVDVMTRLVWSDRCAG